MLLCGRTKYPRPGKGLSQSSRPKNVWNSHKTRNSLMKSSCHPSITGLSPQKDHTLVAELINLKIKSSYHNKASKEAWMDQEHSQVFYNMPERNPTLYKGIDQNTALSNIKFTASSTQLKITRQAEDVALLVEYSLSLHKALHCELERWRAVKSTGCSHRGPRFTSPHPSTCWFVTICASSSRPSDAYFWPL